MGRASNDASPEAEITVEFADPDRDITLGHRISWAAELCDVPEMKVISRPKRPRHPLGIDLDGLASLTGNVLNPDYYREMADYEFFTRLFRRVRLVVTNTGRVAASDVRVELAIAKDKGIVLCDQSDVLEQPKAKLPRLHVAQSVMKGIRPVSRSPGAVDIDADDDRFKLEIECKDLQPGRKVWSDDFFIGIGESGEHAIQGHSYAANLPKPNEFTLVFDADIAQTSLTVDELIHLARQQD